MKSALPVGWKIVPLGTLGRWTGGGTPSKANPAFWVKHGIPWVSPKDMKRSLIDDTEDHISKAAVAESTTNIVPNGSILIVTRSGILSHTLPVAKTLRSVAINQDLKALVAEKPYDPDFLLYALRAHQDRILQECRKSGTTVANLDTDRLLGFGIPIPPYNEQRRVVVTLDSLLERSKTARKELAPVPRLVQRYRGAILAAAFRGDLTDEWRLKNGVPVDGNWRRTTLGAVSTDVRYGTSAKCHKEPKQTPVLRIPNVVNGRIDLSDLKYGSFSKQEQEKLALKVGDLLVIRSNGSLDLVGRAALVPKTVAGYLYAGYLIRIRLDSRQVHPPFVQYAFYEPSIRRHIESLAKSTSGVNNINSEQLKAIPFNIPPLEEQKEIVDKVRSAFSLIDHLRDEADRAHELLDRLDQATLLKAFRGELVTPAQEL